MTATAADIGYNGAFGIETGSPGTYVNIAEIVDLTPPALTRGSVEATHLKSPGRHKEFLPGLFDAGEATFVFNFEKDEYDTVLTAATATAGSNYRITLPNGSTIDFAGFFTNLTPPQMTPEGVMQCNATVKATGQVTYTPAA